MISVSLKKKLFFDKKFLCRAMKIVENYVYDVFMPFLCIKISYLNKNNMYTFVNI